MAARVDPRVARTKAELRSALITLLKSRRWEKIRVQDILELTGISRSAFYSHYGNKFDLLLDGIPELHIEFGDQQPDFRSLFVHIDEAADVVRPLLSQPVLGEVANDYHRKFVKAWRDYLVQPDSPRSAVGEDWIVSELLAGGLLAIAKAYVSRLPRERPELVAERYRVLVADVLASR